MDYAVVGWPADEPTLRLDYQRFSYAGKFVMTNTGKAVARERVDGEIVGAVAFNADRTDANTCWLRYITVRQDRRGEGIGPRLARFAAERARERGFETVRIAVNNPFAYEALYRAGFAYTGQQTGIAELVLEYPTTSGRESYQRGLDEYRGRELSESEREFLADRIDTEPPAVIETPS